MALPDALSNPGSAAWESRYGCGNPIRCLYWARCVPLLTAALDYRFRPSGPCSFARRASLSQPNCPSWTSPRLREGLSLRFSSTQARPHAQLVRVGLLILPTGCAIRILSEIGATSAGCPSPCSEGDSAQNTEYTTLLHSWPSLDAHCILLRLSWHMWRHSIPSTFAVGIYSTMTDLLLEGHTNEAQLMTLKRIKGGKSPDVRSLV